MSQELASLNREEEKNKIKKELYKQPIMAYMSRIRKGLIYYNAEFGADKIHFIVPLEDIGEADFFYAMQAKHLIRWLQ